MNMSSNWIDKKNVFATLWQDITTVISHVQNLDFIDKQDTWSTYCNYGYFISDFPPIVSPSNKHIKNFIHYIVDV